MAVGGASSASSGVGGALAARKLTKALFCPVLLVAQKITKATAASSVTITPLNETWLSVGAVRIGCRERAGVGRT